MIIIQLTQDEFANSIKVATQQAVEAALHQTTNDDELFTRKETANFLNVTLPTINAWEKAGRIKGIRFGHRVFFKKSDLLRTEALERQEAS